ncbi:hypothetical protein HGP17_28210 [Rhizobium sp. P38BS-XIX]|uniref:hypothetical protein n=1 Tax=Rhizobium sp. P38BS-XIX TaxID=2726740 RepID=UPI001456E202|nr:hypothetical protein [Rhizobium sp. P38BS-XIX]NLS00732.1 hypothetical protein [Rhizobium sp. P38BS-XIX]
MAIKEIASDHPSARQRAYSGYTLNDLILPFALCAFGALAVAGVAKAAQSASPSTHVADICDPAALGRPDRFFPDFSTLQYDNSFLNLPGKAVFEDKPSKFRCGELALRDGDGEGMYSTDNVLFVTDRDASSIRVVRITMGSADQHERMADALQKAVGPGVVLKTSVKTKGKNKAGEEIRLITSANYRFYLDSVYMGEQRVGAVVVIRNNDTQAIEAAAKEFSLPAK